MKSQMFDEFLKRFHPVHEHEREEWEEAVGEFQDDLAGREPGLFWYLSSGLDTRALVHFSEKDTSEIYHTPTVDCFVYSDYGNHLLAELAGYYDKLDDGPVELYADWGPHVFPYASFIHGIACIPGRERTLVQLEQMIPLRFFSEDEVSEIVGRHKMPNSWVQPIAQDGLFYYCMITIKIHYFGNEYFPVLYIPMDNWVLQNEIWIPYGIRFDYICSVCDGCRKGGAYRCPTENYSEFLDVLKTPGFWISDHMSESSIKYPNIKKQ